jgi:hypothetical protein
VLLLLLLLLGVDWGGSCYWHRQRRSATVIVSNISRLAALPAEPTTTHTSPVPREFFLICTWCAIVHYLPQLTCNVKRSGKNLRRQISFRWIKPMQNLFLSNGHIAKVPLIYGRQM